MGRKVQAEAAGGGGKGLCYLRDLFVRGGGVWRGGEGRENGMEPVSVTRW